MTTSSFQSDSVALPYVVSLLGALHANEVTAKEYYGACHVAVLEDSAKKVFYRAHWSDVRKGDTVLLAVSAGEIVEVVVEEVGIFARNGFETVSVSYAKAGRVHKGFRWPDATVYVQSRF